jgi:hypothetical protein
MKVRLSLTGIVILALLLTVSGPAAAQQTFQQSDLQGDWSIYVYGGYDAYTETFFGNLNLNAAGGLMTGFGTWRGTDSFLVQGQLVIDAGGGVSGILRCEHSNWNLVFARMSQRKNEITGMAEGKRFYVLIRMVRYNGDVASLPGDEETPPDDTTPEETEPEDPPADDPPEDPPDSGGGTGGGGTVGDGSGSDDSGSGGQR